MLDRMVILFLSFTLAPPIIAFEHANGTLSQQACFAKAMVGMDSVINASLGVPPEHALDLVITNGNFKTLNEPENVHMLNVILNAYFWNESPHSYAINVFFRCAQNTALTGQTVSNEPIPISKDIKLP